MKCPHCQGETDVKDSRRNEENVIRRRRVCRLCQWSFWTAEPPPHASRPDAAKIKQKLSEAKALLVQLQTALHQIEQMTTW